ncbi:MAG: signal peptidase II [Ruminococcaceae bacterium]|nr:signal peptidase II [Oscillospiraceae bacterium]
MQYLFMLLFAGGIVGLDQWTKWLVQENIPLFGRVEAIPGLFSLTYTQNTGAAWSAMEGMIWLFVLIFLVFAAGMVFEFVTKKIGLTTLERWCVVAIFGGGLGNMIDRIRMGYVVDMIRLEFMDFPIFNVADCFITCGCILLMVHLLVFNNEFWKENK